MSEKFTPGPWDFETGVDGIVWVDGPATNICDLYHTDLNKGKGEFVVKPNAIANAHLIAASPCMYEALKAALPYIHHEAEAIIANAQAALAKARGES